MEYQVQINNIKTKLQDTRARKKQQEELIMKVENQALKVCVSLQRFKDYVSMYGNKNKNMYMSFVQHKSSLTENL